MGESLNTALASLKDVINLDVITAKVGELVNMLPAPILALYQEHKVICLMAVVCALALLAFEGYKLFKMALYVGSAVSFGVVGLWYIAPIIPDNIRALVPAVVEFDVLVAVACALVALLICRCAYTLMIMILGGVVGYFVGSTFVYDLLLDNFNTLEFLEMEIVKYIVGGAIASVMVLLFIVLFKHLFIIVTSLGGTICAAFVLQGILLPTADDNMKICFVILAIAIGIFGLMRQYKEEEKALEIVF
jgi:hypothetical protein